MKHDRAGIPINLPGSQSRTSRFQLSSVLRAVVFDVYGLNETTGPTTFSDADHSRMEMSVGRVLSGVDIFIVNDHRQPVLAGNSGEVAIAGPMVMRGGLEEVCGDHGGISQGLVPRRRYRSNGRR